MINRLPNLRSLFLRSLINRKQLKIQRLFSNYESSLPEKYYNEDQLRMQASFRRVIDTFINPNMDAWEMDEAFPAHELFKILGEAGLLGVNKDVDYGGLGLNYKYQAALLEECGTINGGSIPMAFIIQTDQVLPCLNKFGTDQLKTMFLAPSIKGELVGCLGVTEPCGGSDVAAIQATGVKRGDDIVLNGQKMWITNGMQADWMSVIVNTEETGSPYRNKSIICLPLDTKGVSRVKLHKMGMYASDTAHIFLDDVHVPLKNVIGELGKGFQYQMIGLQAERLGGCLSILKTLDKIIDMTLDYTKTRSVFGQRLLDFQTVNFKLAELITEIEALRTLTYWGVDSAIAGHDVSIVASMVKLKGGRLYREVVDSCMQYWGATGYAADSLISRLYRDGRLFSIGGGADEVMLRIISKSMRSK